MATLVARNMKTLVRREPIHLDHPITALLDLPRWMAVVMRWCWCSGDASSGEQGKVVKDGSIASGIR